MATFYLKSGSGVTEFAQSTAYSLGDRMVVARTDTGSNYLVARRVVWECTTAGTTAAANPTWSGSLTYDVTTVTSGTATFTARQPGFSSGTTADWTFATIYAQYADRCATVAGDTVYVSNNHAEAFGEAINMTGANAARWICVDDSVAPPTALASTGVISTAGEFAITFSSLTRSYFYGLTFKCGVGATGTRSLSTGGTLENCTLWLASTGASSQIVGGASAYWKDVWVKFSAAGQSVSSTPSRAWSGGGLASGGTSPTTLMTSSTYGILENLDFTAANAAMNFLNATSPGSFVARNIKMPASWSGAYNLQGAPFITYTAKFFNVGDGVTENFYEKFTAGAVTSETTIVRSGGAATSFNMTTDADAFFPSSVLILPEISRYNSTTGSAITVSVDCVHDSATNLTDQDLILEVSYRSEAGTCLGDSVSSASAFTATPADLSASTATWSGTGSFTNLNKQKVSVTFTPQVAGFIHATVKLAKASVTVYVDPVLQVA